MTGPEPFSASLNVIDPSCEGIDDGQIEVVDILGGQSPYTFTINGVTADSSVIPGLSTGIYNIEVLDDNNCIEELMTELIPVMNSDLVSYQEEYTIQSGESVLIEGMGLDSSYSYNWIAPNDGLSCTDCSTPLASPSISSTYILEIADQAGCTQTVTINIEVEEIRIINTFPNVFSPNNDNTNDEFIFTSHDPQTSALSLTVYDRWGNKVFQTQTDENTITWDGTKNGDELASGVYVYSIVILDVDGNSKVRNGDVLLIR